MSMLEWKTAVLKDTFWEPKKYAISNNRVYIAGSDSRSFEIKG
jgi:hypothetical protein